MKTIVVGYEERPVAERVLERTAQLANAFAAEVIVTSVAPVLTGVVRGGGAYDPVDPPERHEQELQQAATRLKELGVGTVDAVNAIGDPARAILDLADERRADLIVVGAHEGGMLSRVFGGHVGDTIVHKAHADVLVVH